MNYLVAFLITYSAFATAIAYDKNRLSEKRLKYYIEANNECKALKCKYQPNLL